MASKISLEFLQELMNEEDPNVELTSYQLAPGSGRGDNYTAMLYRIYAEGRKDDKPWQRSIIYKCLPDSIVRREAYKSDALFCNEVAFYTKIVPALLRFQRERVEDQSKTFSAVPRCYLARNDVLVLEDLHCRGFSMADRKLGLDTKQCAAVLRELAGLHALSLAMKHQRKEEFLELLNSQDGVSEGLFDIDNEEWYRDYYGQAARNALAMVEEALPSEKGSSDYLRKFRDFVGDGTFFAKMVSLVSPREPLAVFCHGDCWTNNVLFRYDLGEIVEVCLIDFQLVRYGSPALDLANLIYCCTSREQRTEDLPHLLELYHSTLYDRIVELTPEGVQPNEIYDKDKLWEMINEEFHRCGKFGLGLALDMIPISTCDGDQAPDLYQDKDSDTSEPQLEIVPVWTSNETCRRKMADLVRELVDKGDL